MSHSDPKTLVSTDWLAKHLKDPDLRILDASWHMPASERDARAEYDAAHIPGARFFDIDDISDNRSELPHMVPPVEKFISRMRAMGVGDGHQVVVYDATGIFSAARVWWLFRLMGKTDVAAVHDHGAGDILEISAANLKEPALLLFTRDAVPTVDLVANRIVIDPPEGMF